MIVRALDSSNDFTFGKGINNYVKNQDAIAQNIKTRLQSFLGNCFFDLSAGVDWFNLLGGKNRVALELAVRIVILNTSGVTNIRSVDVFYDSLSRAISMTYSVDTVYTDLVVSEPIVGSSSLLLTEDGSVLTTEDGIPIGLG